MFGSQSLELVIGLSFIFFVLASATSSIVEVVSALMQKRANDLERTLKHMLGDKPAGAPATPTVPASVVDTAVFEGLRLGTPRGVWPIRWGEVKPSYMSAKAFADAVGEIIAKTREATGNAEQLYAALPAGLQKRLEPILKQAGADSTQIKAELESWFDDTMGRLEGAYKRWAQVLLFLIGLAIVIAANASAYRMAASLYSDPAVRSAVTEAATGT